jgi:D-alanyl-D-alanine carboxypeptidase
MNKLLLLLLFCTSAYAEHGSYALYNYERAEYQVNFDATEVRPIASITKLFTAITILRSGAELKEKVKVNGRSGGHFSNGMMVSRHDLMMAMMISSDNRAAETLANTYPGGFDKFIRDANDYIRGRGLINTRIEEPTGLSRNNVSTAAELVSFLGAIKDNSALRDYANDRTADIAIPKGKKTIHIKLHNTNPSIFKFDNILISKTGFTNPAGRCVLMLVEKDHVHYAVIVLGTRDIKERSAIANGLITADPLPKVQKPTEQEPIIIFENIM